MCVHPLESEVCKYQLSKHLKHKAAQRESFALDPTGKSQELSIHLINAKSKTKTARAEIIELKRVQKKVNVIQQLEYFP